MTKKREQLLKLQEQFRCSMQVIYPLGIEDINQLRTIVKTWLSGLIDGIESVGGYDIETEYDLGLLESYFKVITTSFWIPEIEWKWWTE